MKRLLIFLLFLTLLSCDAEPKPAEGVGGKSGDVKYWVEGSVLRYDNHCDVSTYRTDNYYSVTVVWCCNTYEGGKARYVSLTFDGNDNWKITSEYISTGICD